MSLTYDEWYKLGAVVRSWRALALLQKEIEAAQPKASSKQNIDADITFLCEMRARLFKARAGDGCEFDYLERMIEDWLAELEDR